MKKILSIALLLFVFCVSAQSVQSPSKQILLDFGLTENGRPTYSVTFNNKPVILQSALGIYLKDGSNLATNFSSNGIKNITYNESWKPVLGEQASIVNHYNEMTVALSQADTNRKMNIIFKVYDEGVAFRYEFPKQKDLNYFIITEEKTEFNLAGNHKTFWIPGDYDSQEYPYEETKFSEINTDNVNLKNGIGLKTIFSKYAVQSPLMMKSEDGIYINIFEAAVVNYPV